MMESVRKIELLSYDSSNDIIKLAAPTSPHSFVLVNRGGAKKRASAYEAVSGFEWSIISPPMILRRLAIGILSILRAEYVFLSSAFDPESAVRDEIVPTLLGCHEIYTTDNRGELHSCLKVESCSSRCREHTLRDVLRLTDKKSILYRMVVINGIDISHPGVSMVLDNWAESTSKKLLYRLVRTFDD